MTTPPYPQEPEQSDAPAQQPGQPAQQPGGYPAPYGQNPYPAQAPYGQQPPYPPQQPYPPQAQPAQGQPQYAPQQYPQQPTADPAPYAPSPAESGRNPLGLVAAILGAIPLVLGLLSTVVTTAVLRSGGYQMVGLAGTLFTGLGFLLGAAALVLGFIALNRKGRPKALAGIGVGLGAAAVWGGLTSALYGGLMAFPY